MKSPELYFLSRLSDYTLKSFLTRVLLVSSTAALFLYIAVQVAGDKEITLGLMEFLRTIFIFNLITEGNVLFDHLAERRLPIPEKISLRLLLHAMISLLMGAVVLAVLLVNGHMSLLFVNPVLQLMILFGLIFIFILILVSVTLRIIEKWVHSVRQLDELKTLKLSSDYQALQDQLNPHFLFNNLSVLKSMIVYEADAAVQFTQNFTDVYRYVLDSREKATVRLADELQFLKAYLALHKERMGAALEVDFQISQQALHRELPPLALQLLAENALKHNVALRDKPLRIEITASESQLMVRNRLQPKESDHSEKTGLNNLRQRYALLASKSIEVNQNSGYFEVVIPLL